MPAPIITIDQATLDPGTPGSSRSDGVLGQLVTLTDAEADNVGGSYTWSMLASPTGSAATLSNPGTSSPTFTPDVEGTYIIRCSVIVLGVTSASVANQGGFAVRLPNGTRIPAPGETYEFGDTGYHDDMDSFFRAVDALL
jgi:hypothetical protein